MRSDSVCFRETYLGLARSTEFDSSRRDGNVYQLPGKSVPETDNLHRSNTPTAEFTENPRDTTRSGSLNIFSRVRRCGALRAISSRYLFHKVETEIRCALKIARHVGRFGSSLTFVWD